MQTIVNKLKLFPERYEYDLRQVLSHPVEAAKLLQLKAQFLLDCGSSFTKTVRTPESSKSEYDNHEGKEHYLYDSNVPFEIDCCGIIRTAGFRDIRNYVASLIVDRVPQDKGLFLDFGSGNGFNARILSEKFPHAEIYCIDISGSRLRHAQNWIGEKNNIQYRQMNGAHLQFPDNIFDFVYSCHTLEQMESVIEDAVSEIIRVMKYHAVLIEPIWENADLVQQLYMEKQGYVKSLLSEIRKHSNVRIVENFVRGFQSLTFNQSSVIVIEKNRPA